MTAVAVGPLLIRADASPTIGTGHIMRCRAVASAWGPADRTVFFTARDCPEGIREQLKRDAYRVESVDHPVGSTDDVQSLIDRVRSMRASAVILDGYHFGPEYQKALADAGVHEQPFRRLIVDDTSHLDRYDADLLLNHSPHARPTDYAPKTNATMLLGPRYALVRPEFLPYRAMAQPIGPTVRRIMVTLGGADPPGFGVTILEALGQLPDADLQVDFIAGAANPRWQLLQERCRPFGNRVTLHRHVDNPADLMSRADLVVTAGGSTCLEAAYLARPMAVAVIAENQVPVVAAYAELDAVEYLGRHDQLDADPVARKLQNLMNDPVRRAILARTAGDLVDGRGPERIVRALRGERPIS